MCYDDNARPPVPPGATGEARGEEIVLTAGDGNRFSAYLASPVNPPRAQIVIYPDVRGLHQFYKELALRFAEVGIGALALDYFGRTAGLTSRAEPFEYMPHVQQLRLDTFSLDVAAALKCLREKHGKIPTFVIGFCMGGSLVIMTGTDSQFEFAGLIPFYSGFSRAFGDRGTAMDNAAQVRYPLLGVYGGADQGIPENVVKQFDEKLDGAAINHEIVIYPGAPHSFFDRRAAEYADASRDAWSRVLKFIGV